MKINTFVLTPQAMKFSAKAAVDKEWKKLETIPAWQLEKVKSKKEIILEAQRDKKKVHSATLMDICHFNDVELEPNFQKRKGRVVLLGVVVTKRLWSSKEILKKTRTDLQDRNIKLGNVEDSIIIMMFYGNDWTKRGNSETCISNSEPVKNYAKILARTLDIPRPRR